MKNILSLLSFLMISCTNVHTKKNNDEVDVEGTQNDNVVSINSDCGFDDGTHSATVDYYNPKTNYSSTYDLDVEVEDCQVTTIYFDNGGFLDNSHIDAADIDDKGNANVEDDTGRSYDVHIDE